MAQNLPNLAKDIKLQVQETKRTLNRINCKPSTLNRIILKLLKSKQRKKFSEAEQDGFAQGNPTAMTADFSSETTEAAGSARLQAFHVPPESCRECGLCVGQKCPLRTNGEGRRSQRKSESFSVANLAEGRRKWEQEGRHGTAEGATSAWVKSGDRNGRPFSS